MKIITYIQSISDIITNSSSEVFLMDEHTADYYYNLENTENCVNIQEITWDWIWNEGIWEWRMVCEFLNIDENILGDYTCLKEDDWHTFLDIYEKEIKEKLVGLYFVDIEDHFLDAYDVIEDARDNCYWSDYRH